ncbi:MAG: HAD-IC family P-type ATPase, partial [Pirellulales bacterium]|nr:HAD-IC family P-type ATPase [Pirellulales bacterium]
MAGTIGGIGLENDRMRTGMEQQWHQLPVSQTLQLLDVDADRGLAGAQVETRRERFGDNSLTRQRTTGPVVLFLMQLHQPLVYILLAAVVVTSLLREWVDAGVILGVVMVNALIGFIQESKAIRAIEALSGAMSSDATVLRGGQKHRVAAQDLVPGDIVFLQSGDKTPADLRLLRSRELRVDESALTGESIPVEKQTDPLERQTVLADRTNMAFSSSLVTYGTGIGVVTETGDRTAIGRINALLAATDILATPLTRRIQRFSR